MRIIISDSSCLIDLRKALLLGAFLKLPYEFLIPNTLFDEELLKFTAAHKKALLHGGLKVIDLPGEAVLRAQTIVREFPQLSVHDGFAFALAERHPHCILLSGDQALRTLAATHEIEVHGVLWVLDELHSHDLVSVANILTILRDFLGDRTIRLPRRELTAYIRRYEGMK